MKTIAQANPVIPAPSGRASVRQVVLLLVLLQVFACAAITAHAGGMASGRVLSQAHMLGAANQAVPPVTGVPAVLFNATGYAEVKRDWIDGFLRRFQADLSRKSVPVSKVTGKSGWQERFNCTAFTDLFIGDAAAELMVDLWHSDLPVQRPAILAIWYTPDKAARDARTGLRRQHCIALVITDRGPVFVDPQCGVVELTARELGTVTHRRA